MRRIVACWPQHHNELAGLAIKTWGAGTEPSPKTLGASGSLWDTYGRAHRAASGRRCRIPNMVDRRSYTGWLAFLNTVRTERFEQVLALRPSLLAIAAHG